MVILRAVLYAPASRLPRGSVVVRCGAVRWLGGRRVCGIDFVMVVYFPGYGVYNYVYTIYPVIISLLG